MRAARRASATLAAEFSNPRAGPGLRGSRLAERALTGQTKEVKNQTDFGREVAPCFPNLDGGL